MRRHCDRGYVPVGVDARSFDVWRWPDLFAAGASTGCPPDQDLFACRMQGQVNGLVQYCGVL